MKIEETVFLKLLIINLNYNIKNSTGKVPDGGSKNKWDSKKCRFIEVQSKISSQEIFPKMLIKKILFWPPHIQKKKKRFLKNYIAHRLEVIEEYQKHIMIITDTPGTVFDKIALDVVGPLSKTKNGYEN